MKCFSNHFNFSAIVLKSFALVVNLFEFSRQKHFKVFSNYMNFRAKNISKYIKGFLKLFEFSRQNCIKEFCLSIDYLNFRAKNIIFDFSRQQEIKWEKLKNFPKLIDFRVKIQICDLSFWCENSNHRKNTFWLKFLNTWIFAPK